MSLWNRDVLQRKCEKWADRYVEEISATVFERNSHTPMSEAYFKKARNDRAKISKMVKEIFGEIDKDMKICMIDDLQQLKLR